MPSADVVVVGAGLAGLATAHALAGLGARVLVLAEGHATSHWVGGSLDVAAPPGATTTRDGLRRLAARPSHPYALLAAHVGPAVEVFRDVTTRQGLPYAGELDTPLRPLPTGIGGVRPVAIVPAGQADALEPWAHGEALVICGIEGFKDFWPTAVAASLARPAVWQPGDGPTRVVPARARLPGLAERRNLTALHVARAFDDPAWRARAVEEIARAVDEAARGRTARVGLPAALGLREHGAVLAQLRDRLGRAVFELPLVPPSIPGLRLYDAWRTALRQAGVRIQIGERIGRVEVEDGAVRLVATPAAVRELTVRTAHLVLATGGITGGGIVGRHDGRLEETVLGLPVDAPDRSAWMASEPFPPGGHGIEAAGIPTDAELRPVDSAGRPTHANVRVVGSLLAGQRWLRERCGDGVALASARLAAEAIAGSRFTAAPPLPTTADTTSAHVRARGEPAAYAATSGERR
jgi:glycerol-3-phosphate dehydrogenase subunit B